MILITEWEFENNRKLLYKKIKEGSLFIYPTDTIYGIGCNAESANAVKKVREAKNRPENPFSVIAPSKEWIKKNCILSKKAESYLKKLPGPYTLILKLKNKGCIAKEVNNGLGTLGVRIPGHWISDKVKELGIPIITTSANIAGKEFMTDLESLSATNITKVGFIVYEGKKHGRPSEIIDLTKENPVTKKR